MNNIMKPYIDLGKEIIEDGNDCQDRTGAGTLSIFGKLLEFDVRKGAPFLTERSIPIRNVIGELLWFLEGSTNVDVLHNDYRCLFWDEWSSPVTKTIGPMYGEQWRNAGGVDQLKDLIDTAIRTPDSRRLVISSWAPDVLPLEHTAPMDNPELGYMSLAPCHYAYQFRIYDNYSIVNVDNKCKWVDLMFNLRSSDYFLGLPNNIASYYILQVMVAKHLSMKTGILHLPRKLKVSLGDVHIYKNHIDACKELFKREPSQITPMFKCDYNIFKTYLEKTVTLTPDVRNDMVNAVRRGIFDYKPGDKITGARNV